jgi:hypothetical protein
MKFSKTNVICALCAIALLELAIVAELFLDLPKVYPACGLIGTFVVGLVLLFVPLPFDFKGVD